MYLKKNLQKDTKIDLTWTCNEMIMATNTVNRETTMMGTETQ